MRFCVCVSVKPQLRASAEAVMGPGKGLSTEAIKPCVCWNNVFDLALGQQQVLGGPAWSCCSLPALMCRPGTSLPFAVFPSHHCPPPSLSLFLSSSLQSLSFSSLLSLRPFPLSVSLFLVALLLLPLSF